VEYVTVVQWKSMFQRMRQKGITGQIRKFDEEADTGLIRMKMIALWEADQTMQHRVSERDNPCTFLA
jgi:hypothetical protein